MSFYLQICKIFIIFVRYFGQKGIAKDFGSQLLKTIKIYYEGLDRSKNAQNQPKNNMMD